MHIIGGSQNESHIIYDLSINKLNNIYKFNNNPKRVSLGFLYNKPKTSSMMFGGHSSDYLDDFYIVDLNDTKNGYK